MNPSDIIKFKRFGLDDGLSQSAVTCITQDCLGFIWIGTHDGLNRYDGHKFTVYKSDKSDPASLSSNMIFSLYEDTDDNFWVGTISGLNRYDRRLDRFERFTSKERGKNFPVDQIRAIAQASDGTLLLATYGGGLTLFDFQREKFNTYGYDGSDGISYPKLNSLLVDLDGRIMIGTWGGGVDEFDMRKKKFRNLFMPDQFKNSVSHKRVNHMSLDKEGTIYCSTNGGLFTIGRGDSKLNKLILPEQINNQESELISYAMKDKDDNLLICTREQGLWLKRKDDNRFMNFLTDKFSNESISNNSLTCLFQDESGLMWAGTYGDGFNCFETRRGNVLNYVNDPGDPNSLVENKVYSLLEDSEGLIWIGTRGKGVCILDRKTNMIRQMKELLDENILGREIVLCLEEDDDGNIWIGTSGGGIICYDKSNEKYIEYRHKPGSKDTILSDTVFSIKKDCQGRIWVGTAGGINCMDKSGRMISSYVHNPHDQNSLASNRARCICFDSSGALWIATEYGGLNCLDVSSGSMKRIKEAKGERIDTSLYCVTVDSRGIVWAGSLSGIYRFDPHGNELTIITERNGLLNSFINSILQHSSGYLWVTTNYGSARISPDGKVVETYDRSNGFESNEFAPNSAIILRDGKLAIGGLNGFSIFDPDGFHKSIFKPRLVFTEFRIFNTPITPEDGEFLTNNSIWCANEINISYRESVISFGFSCMDFRVPAKVNFKYKMEGFDKNWVDAGHSRLVTYTNLNPGEYQFKVSCTNCDGVWTEENRSLRLRISPPFWKTKWFKALSGLSAVAAGSLIYQNKLEKVRKEKRAQEEFTRKLMDAQEADRKRIASELHDSIGHGLLISKNKLLMSIKESELNEDARENLEQISEMLSGTLSEVREISYNLHPYQIERLGIAKAIRSIVDRVSGSVGIAFTSDVEEIDGILPPESEITLYRIVQESINNIIKHSLATEAILNVSRNANEVSVYISDNGRGLGSGKNTGHGKSKGLGLEGMKERARIIGASLEVESGEDLGTVVKVRIPLKKKTHL